MSTKPTPKVKVLITGTKGLLGLALLDTIPQNIEIVPTVLLNTSADIGGHKFISLDITNVSQVEKIVAEHMPAVVIHAASLGNVDYCEKNKVDAHRVNVLGTANVIEACKNHGAKLLFISSNAIFDGLSAPYSETSSPNPNNYYGQTKVEAESLVTNSGLNFLIVRLLLMYGWNHVKERQNPVTWLLSRLALGNETNLVTDIYINPVYNMAAAKAIWKAIDIDLEGTIHLAGKERVNRYEFGLITAKEFGFDNKLLHPVTSDYFSDIAPRMPDTTYDTQRMEITLGLSPISITEGLRDMIARKPSL